jgi:hypothetical protein
MLQLRQLAAIFTPWWPGLGHMGFVVEKATLGQVFSRRFGFTWHSFHKLFHAHHHLPSVAVQYAKWTSPYPKTLKKKKLF